jgi:ubiquinol-cytochrome c reductase cytochrome b subunit
MAHFTKATSVMDWLNQRIAANKLEKVFMSEYWIPKNINFLWAMGMVLVITFVLLLVSGIFLLMYYVPTVEGAFYSVNYTIMREVGFGWLWRHIHGVAASVSFLIMYIHLFTGIYYGSYKKGRELIWISGMLLFISFSAEAFSGYMLPWGQMSYWAGMVITNLFAGGSLHADGLVEWIRGDYIPAQAFLGRFFMLHVVLLPLAIIGLIALHFGALRIPHVNNQDGEEIDFEAESKKYLAGDVAGSKVMRFGNDFLSKDMMVVGIYLVFFFYLVFYNYGFAMDPVNFDPADGLKTPAHIYPEWYFLWSYEILRPFSIDLGLALFGFAQVIFVALPFLDRSPNTCTANRRGKAFSIWFWLMLSNMVVLTAMGKLPPEDPYSQIGLVGAIIFVAQWLLLPIITSMEKKV